MNKLEISAIAIVALLAIASYLLIYSDSSMPTNSQTNTEQTQPKQT